MSNTIYLYLKTHNVTGLKYLGKTVKDPFKYTGSGIRWKNHLKKHGNDVSTEILYQTKCEDDFKNVAIEYSKKLNIVESKEFANMTEEQGQGGATRNGYKTSQITKNKIGAANLGNTHSKEAKAKISLATSGSRNPNYGKTASDHCKKINSKIHSGKILSKEHREAISKAQKEFKKKKVKIDGDIYNSCAEAAAAYGYKSQSVISRWIKQGKATRC